MGLSINIRSRDRTREPETRRPGCPTASLLQDWVSLPGLVDGVASPDPEHVLASAMQLEVISRRHPEWLNPFQATLSCVAGLQRCGPAGLCCRRWSTALPVAKARVRTAERSWAARNSSIFALAQRHSRHQSVASETTTSAEMTLPPVVPRILQPMPAPVAELAGRLAFARVLARHPKLLDRLGEYGAKTFCFAPSDLPFEFAVTPRSAKVRAARRGRILRYDAKISGPVVLLLALAEGRLDGDAEFFGRQIAIDGDMEAVLALRNAVENDVVDFARDLAPAHGPLRTPVERVLGHVRSRLLAREERRWN